LKAQFSLLAPGAHILPHAGPTNERLAISLGLVGLDTAEMRVGSTWRRWEELPFTLRLSPS
jgi:aspartyl/asparaginyl beta-hydroxylase (cupin superfamily)